jgi:hypothetical protein
MFGYISESTYSYRGIDRPDVKTLRFVTLFSCGASGCMQTTLLGPGRCGRRKSGFQGRGAFSEASGPSSFEFGLAEFH